MELLSSTTYNYGTKITKEPIVQHTGNSEYEFYGWSKRYDKVTEDDMIAFPYTITQSVSMYSVWVKKKIKLSFNTNGGYPATYPEVTMDMNSKFNSPGKPKRKDNESFTGWYTEDGVLLESGITNLSASTTAYAHYVNNGNIVVHKEHTPIPKRLKQVFLNGKITFYSFTGMKIGDDVTVNYYSEIKDGKIYLVTGTTYETANKIENRYKINIAFNGTDSTSGEENKNSYIDYYYIEGATLRGFRVKLYEKKTITSTATSEIKTLLDGEFPMKYTLIEDNKIQRYIVENTSINVFGYRNWDNSVLEFTFDLMLDS